MTASAMLLAATAVSGAPREVFISSTNNKKERLPYGSRSSACFFDYFVQRSKKK